MCDDYDFSLLDWGSNNSLAVVMGGFIYLWNAVTGGIVDVGPFDDIGSNGESVIGT